jgi:4-hydroxy-4-methyl-2-oxoglutarate aldolase
MSDTAGDLAALGSAMVHEANGRRGALGASFAPLWQGAAAVGPARTAFAPPGDNLAAHVALERCQPGEVLCLASTAAGAAFGGWGEVVTRYALAQGVAALVTAIGVRDIDAIAALGFPVFGPSLTVQGTVKRSTGRQDVPVFIGAAVVRPGDWVVADADGVVVVGPQCLDAVLDRGRAKVRAEAEAFGAIEAGASTRAALGLP